MFFFAEENLTKLFFNGPWDISSSTLDYHTNEDKFLLVGAYRSLAEITVYLYFWKIANKEQFQQTNVPTTFKILHHLPSNKLYFIPIACVFA